MRHFIFVDDYEINPNYGKGIKKKSLVPVTLAALYVLSKRKASGSSSGGGFTATDKRQNCVVKMNYSYSINAHNEQVNRYLKREGVGKEGQTPTLFGIDVMEYQKNMVPKNMRIFVSPANTDVPLEVLTKKLVEKLEMQTGYQLFWVGTEHHNTAHPHSHILINGVDKNGKDVFIPHDLVKTLLRETARDLCTSLVGERTNEDIEREKESRIVSNRFCVYDTMILRYVKDNRVNPESFLQHKELYAKRLEHLKSMNLCRWDATMHQYVFENNWDETLKTVGRYNMFLEAKKVLRYTDVQNYQLYDSGKGCISGIVTKIYRTDENSDNHAAIIEGVDGKAYFVPLLYKPRCKENHFVKITPVANQKGRLVPRFEYTTLGKLREEAQFKGFNKGFAKTLNSFDNTQQL